MSHLLKIVSAGFFALIIGLGLASPAAADVSIRDSVASDLYVREANPSVHQLEKQFAAFWNPNIGMDPKIEVSYHGSSARPALEMVMQQSKTMDFFSIQGRVVEGPTVSGDSLSVRVNGVMAGYPATTMTYYFVREGGLWKYDWKRICQENQCSGDPDFGY
ncbi:hypothetical protein [Nocardia lasii]|uniref:Low molecular weight antigen MTB12-like C-terminal domain-containing protein n=1 Tax=Nocardia lasii TaxID=1616107 RepID=A0ABW1JZ96_9NOCA